jgi:peptide-methionine (S)-S-oxide reductase
MATTFITLGGGCFWCLEAVYELVDGVVSVESGYSNGHITRPSYEQVCEGDTGHAEVVCVEFEPQRITLREILEIFFAIHDHTEPAGSRCGASVPLGHLSSRRVPACRRAGGARRG